MRIFIHRGSQTLGPYSLEDIGRELSRGSLKPTDMATYEGGDNRFMPLTSVPGVAGTTSVRPSNQQPRARLGCGVWTLAAVGVLFVVGLIGELVTKHGDQPATDNRAESGQRPLTPREFGLGLGRELLRNATTDSGSFSMVTFAEGCRAENPTVKTYSPAEFNQFQDGLISAYVQWRLNGYTVPNGETKDNPPSVPTPANTSPRWHAPRPPYPAQARAKHITGTGVCHIVLDATGHVSTAVMSQSTGSDLLDRYTIAFVTENWTGPPNGTHDTTFAYSLP